MCRLPDNDVGNHGVAAISRALKQNSTLTHLNLDNTNIGITAKLIEQYSESNMLL